MVIFSHISNWFSELVSIIRFTDVVDILFVSYIIYMAINFVVETRAGQLVKGIVALVIIYFVSDFMQLYTMSYILKNTMQVGVLALLVVFQPELRRLLEKMGGSKLFGFLSSASENIEKDITEVIAAVDVMSSQRIGALIVFEKETKLGEIIKTGTEIEALISSGLIINIFIPNTPLHDGAIIVREGKIMAASCLLPLTANNNLSRELGTRHRAAIGVTEVSDSVVVVVSEETGKISFVTNGKIERGLTPKTLEAKLQTALNVGIDQKKTWKERVQWLKK